MPELAALVLAAVGRRAESGIVLLTRLLLPLVLKKLQESLLQNARSFCGGRQKSLLALMSQRTRHPKWTSVRTRDQTLKPVLIPVPGIQYEI